MLESHNVQTTLSSKILGAETELFSKMAVDAVKGVMIDNIGMGV